MSGRTTDIMGVRNQQKKLISFCHQKKHEITITCWWLGANQQTFHGEWKKPRRAIHFATLATQLFLHKTQKFPFLLTSSFNTIHCQYPTKKTIQIFSRGTCLCIMLVQELSLIVVLLQKYCSPWFLRLNHDSSPNWHIFIYIYTIFCLFVCLVGWLFVRSFVISLCDYLSWYLFGIVPNT